MRNLVFVVVILAVFIPFVASVWATDSENVAKIEAYNNALALKQQAERMPSGRLAPSYATRATLDLLFAIYHQNEEIIKLLKERAEKEKQK